MPAGGKDVCKEGEGGFVGIARGKFEGVEIGEGDAEVLRLEFVSQDLRIGSYSGQEK